jgi:hypothetical protein
LNNFKIVVGKKYNNFRSTFTVEKVQKILDEEGFERSTLNREILLDDLRQDGFFQGLAAPAPLAPQAGNNSQLQSLAFFFVHLSALQLKLSRLSKVILLLLEFLPFHSPLTHSHLISHRKHNNATSPRNT